MSGEVRCGNHRIAMCAWAPGLYQLWGRKEDGTSCCHGELFRYVKDAEEGIRKLDGDQGYTKYMAFKKEFYARKRAERRAAKAACK